MVYDISFQYKRKTIKKNHRVIIFRRLIIEYVHILLLCRFFLINSVDCEINVHILVKKWIWMLFLKHLMFILWYKV